MNNGSLKKDKMMYYELFYNIYTFENTTRR